MASGRHEKFGVLNILVLFLSVYVLAALFIDTVFKLPEEISSILSLVDNGICLVFLTDFSIRFYKAESKSEFMKWGWIDLVSSVPTLDLMRGGRILRLIRLLRIVRSFRTTKSFVEHVFSNKSQGALSMAAVIAVLMVIFSSIAILQVETDPESNITTAEDALWWSYVTITTVGYGDKFPVTSEGRAIAVLLMTIGVGLFGTFTAYIASWFVADNKKVEHDIEEEELVIS